MAKAIDYSKMTEREAEQAAYAERTESGSRYRRFCEAVAANAKGYKTKKACDLMVGRVVALWKRRGCYGIERPKWKTRSGKFDSVGWNCTGWKWMPAGQAEAETKDQPRETSPGQSSRFSRFRLDYTGHNPQNKRYYHHAERKVREARTTKQGAEQWQQ